MSCSNGFHSVIDSPDSVSRVIAPTTAMAKHKPAIANSHMRTARDAAAGAALGNKCRSGAGRTGWD
jgi:hypothetical protein